ncbi:4'-phosphopantetheinyl transferase family protein [Amycolatopsis rubida]|uniref:4'-phosphopantetheinyl transferase EntD (Siderophore biosynthesis) n=1 Tax=Amycolatopsis rubida TaxID=112413 RepID=A0A1I5S7R6_9PSEU|nr:4'-phosphopantetheinyl transferase superfamily protein [Amycolatopsis rubida]SFP66637.1 4'-phosphopantetheinyl transferase EntD (siderophore biosynthesis) [Amycolatopsis rubida]
MIEHVLPAAAAGAETTADVDPSASDFLERGALAPRTRRPRLAEFATGRSCARTALRELGAPAGPVGRGPHREPHWPPGIVGSITHCPGYRAAAVARACRVRAIGIDAEPHRPLSPRMFARITSAAERRELAALPWTGAHVDRIVFSAKESVYKAWFPMTGADLGFTDVRLSLDPLRRRFVVELPAPFAPVRGRYAVACGRIVTAVAVPADGIR